MKVRYPGKYTYQERAAAMLKGKAKAMAKVPGTSQGILRKKAIKKVMEK